MSKHSLAPRLSSVMAVSLSLFLTRLSAPSCMEVLPEQKTVIQAESLRAVFFFFSGNHRLRECSHLTFCELLSSHLLNGGNKEKFRELIWGLSGRALISLASFHYWSPKRAEKAARATTVFSENLKRSREVQ